AQRDRLLLLVARDGIGLPADVGLELLARFEEHASLLVELRRRRALEAAELLAVSVVVEHREARLRRPERELFAAERHPRLQDRVLERIVLLCELRGDHA